MITWNVLRAGGIAAYLTLWGSVAWGLASTTSLFGKRVVKATSVALHQALSTAGLLLLAVHLTFVVVDPYVPFSPLDLVVPMRSTYRPVGVTLGIAAMLVLMLGVLATSWGRKLIGTRWWRRMHSLSVPALALALVHGLMTGTDSRRPVMFWLYVFTTSALLFLLLLRAFTVGLRPDRARPHRSTARLGPQSSPARSSGSLPRSEAPAVPASVVGGGAVRTDEVPLGVRRGDERPDGRALRELETSASADGAGTSGATETRIGRAGSLNTAPERRTAMRTRTTASPTPTRPESKTRPTRCIAPP